MSYLSLVEHMKEKRIFGQICYHSGRSKPYNTLVSFDKFLGREENRHKEGEIKVRAVLEIRASVDQTHTKNSYNIINFVTNKQ